jgi:hypothetical protein
VKQNLGDADRTLRMMAGAILGVIFFNLPHDTVGVVVGIACIIALVSSVTGWSLFYFLLRISTRSEKDVKPLERVNGA